MTATTEQRVNALIADRGGSRVADDWKTVESKIRVRCKEGHEWHVRPSSLLYMRTWCSRCQSKGRRLGLAEMNRIARGHGGGCVSKIYRSNLDKLDWVCSEGHTFSLTAKTVSSGGWCPTCRRSQPAVRHQYAFNDALEHARKNGGEHVGECSLIWRATKWRCQNGHEFECSGWAIMKRQQFCQECDDRKEKKLAAIKKECAERGGECVSDTFRNISTPMNFRCGKGHEWTSRWRNVGLNGSWCPTCAKSKPGSKRKHSRPSSQPSSPKDLAAQMNHKRPHAWPCINGHDDDAARIVGEQMTCGTCARLTAAADRIAAEMGGECLNVFQQQWRCESGHRFNASLSEAALAWCPECSQGVSVRLGRSIEATLTHRPQADRLP